MKTAVSVKKCILKTQKVIYIFTQLIIVLNNK